MNSTFEGFSSPASNVKIKNSLVRLYNIRSPVCVFTPKVDWVRLWEYNDPLTYCAYIIYSFVINYFFAAGRYDLRHVERFLLRPVPLPAVSLKMFPRFLLYTADYNEFNLDRSIDYVIDPARHLNLEAHPE